MPMPTRGVRAHDSVVEMNSHSTHDQHPSSCAPDAVPTTSDTRPWFLRSTRSESINWRVVLAGVFIPALITIGLGLALGLGLNKSYTGSFTGGTGVVKAELTLTNSQTGQQVVSPEVGKADLNAALTGFACAAVAVAMSLVRFAVRNFTHPRYCNIPL